MSQLFKASRKPFLTILLLFIIASLVLAYPTMADDAGLALRFDGVDDHVELPRTNTLMGSTSWAQTKTLSVWVKPPNSSPPSTTPPDGEVILGNDRPHTFGLSRAIFNGLDRIWIWNVDSNGMDFIGVEYAPDEWIHLALVHTDGELIAYKNGSLVSSINSGATYMPSSTADGTFFIGGTSRNDSNKAFQGDIDEVRFWNSALSENLIETWQGTELSSSHPEWGSLAAYYKMSDGSGTVLTDDSGNSNSGSLMAGMGDANWVVSQAFHLDEPTPTHTQAPPTGTPSPTMTNPPTTATPTDLPTTSPSDTPTEALSATPTSEPSTATPPPTSTNTQVTSPSPSPTPTATPVPPSTTPSATPTATSDASGAGFALAFDGTTDFVELDETSQILGPGWEDTKTVSLWVRPDSFTGQCDRATPAWCPVVFGDRPRWWGISIGEVVGLDRIWLWNYDGSSNSPVEMIPVDYTPGEWVHIAMVHENGELRGFRNGTLISTLPSGSTVQPNTGAHPILHFGGIIVSSSRNWTSHVTIDELRLWSIARSETEIQASLNVGLTGTEPGLAAYYRMSDGSGAMLTDDSLNSWTGILQDGSGQVPPDGDLPQWVLSDAPINSNIPTATATQSEPSPSPTSNPTNTSTPAGATATPTMVDSATPTPIPSATPTTAATATDIALPTNTATNPPPTATPTLEATPTATLEPSPTQTGFSLTQIGHLDTDGYSYDIALDGSNLYLADTRSGLRIIDIQNPTTPVELSNVALPSRNYGVASEGNYVYATTTRDGLFVIDVSDPANPAIVGQFTGTTYAWKVSVRDGYAYVSDRLDGLYILDVTDPTQPQQVSLFATSDQSLDSAFGQQFIYLADYRAGVHVLDISNPENPLYLNTVDTGTAHSVTVHEDLLLVSDGSSGLQIFDLSDPASPVNISTFPTSGSFRDASVEGNIAYVADWTNGLLAVDISVPANPTHLDTLATSGSSVGVKTQTDLIYLADYQNGLLIVQTP